MELIRWAIILSPAFLSLFVGIACGRWSQKKLDSELLRDRTWSGGYPHIDPKRKQATKEQLGE